MADKEKIAERRREITLLKRVQSRKARTLVVDDEQTMRLLLAQALRSTGFKQVFRAGDGEAALKLMRDEGCDLALVDWNMPRMNGLQLLDEVRSDPDLSQMVFVVITGEAMDQKVIQAAEEFHDAYLTKPISPEKLARRLDIILDIRLTKARAMLLETQGQVERAVDEYLNAASNRPGSVWTYFGLAALLGRHKRYGEAERCFKRILDMDNDAVAALVELGKLRQAQGDKGEARALFSQAYNRNPKFFRAYDAMAESLMQSGYIRSALEVLKSAVREKGTENAMRQETMGELNYKLGLYPEAEAAYSKAIKLKPKLQTPGANLALGRTRLAMGLLKEALPPLTKASEMAGGEEEVELKLDAMLLAASAHAQAGDITTAEEVLAEMEDESIWPGGKLPFDKQDLDCEAGGVYLRAGNQTMASQRFEKSLAADPDNTANIKRMREICGQTAYGEDFAEDLVMEAVEDIKGKVERLTRKGLDSVSEGHFKDALENYREGLLIDPNQGRLHYNLARLLLRMGRTEEAVEALMAAGEKGLMRKDWQLLAEVIRFYARKQLADEAVLLLKKALSHPEADESLADLMEEIRAV